MSIKFNESFLIAYINIVRHLVNITGKEVAWLTAFSTIQTKKYRLCLVDGK